MSFQYSRQIPMVVVMSFKTMVQVQSEIAESVKQTGNVDEESTRPQTERGRGLRVLVVDDNRDSAETMGMLLEIDGHEIFVAHDGRQAVEVALSQRPDAVLLDLGLPYLNGYDACRAMRMGGLTNALIVAMTGYGQDEDRRLSHEAGFNAHLVKPVDLKDVRQLLAQKHRENP
jgi:CheY-like chemotaxis protein